MYHYLHSLKVEPICSPRSVSWKTFFIVFFWTRNIVGELAAVLGHLRILRNAEDLGQQPLCLCLPSHLPDPFLDWTHCHHLCPLQDDVGDCAYSTIHEGIHGRAFVGKLGLRSLPVRRFDVGCHDCRPDLLLPRPGFKMRLGLQIKTQTQDKELVCVHRNMKQIVTRTRGGLNSQ